MKDRQHKHGRSLTLYLVDGSPTGVITAELGNWTGKVLSAPRSRLADLIRRPETGQTGVYLLTGPDPDRERTLVYVGEGDVIKTRLVAHDRDEGKQFFTRVYVVVSKDDNITKAHGRYLESRILRRIREAMRGHPVNGTEPEFSGLPEAEIANMERFLMELEVILPVLGFDLLRGEHLAERAVPAQTERTAPAHAEVDPIFEFTRSGVHAQAREIGGEFVVLAGSTARAEETDSCLDGIKAQRRQLIDDGALVKDPDSQRYRFAHDVPFGSPSGAASVVYGGGVSGRVGWKVQGSGRTYGEWRDGSLAAAQESARSAVPAHTERAVPEQSEEDPIFEFNRAGTHAQAREVGDEFVVLAGSTARASEVDSCSDRIKAKRKQLIDDGVLVKDPDSQRFVFSHDVPFGRPSGAASVVGGCSANGRVEWRVQGSGKTYGEWRDESLAAAQGVQSS